MPLFTIYQLLTQKLTYIPALTTEILERQRTYNANDKDIESENFLCHDIQKLQHDYITYQHSLIKSNKKIRKSKMNTMSFL